MFQGAILKRRGGTAAAISLTFGAITLLAGPEAATAAGPFMAPVVVGSGASEPGVHVAPDGTVYVEGPVGFASNLPGSPSALWRSGDAGASWVRTPDSLRANQPGGGDSTLSIDPSGNLAWGDLWLGASTVGKSTDKANSWLAQPLGGLPVQDREWLGSTTSSVYLTYHQIPGGIVVSRSVDGGLTYPVTTSAATVVDQTGCVCPPGNLIAEDGGLLGDKVGVIFATSTGGVGFSRSSNSGLTFSVSPVSPAGSANTGLAFPVVANAGGGHLYATWLEVTGNSSSVHFSSSGDWGATWNAPRTIVGSGTSVYPWVAARGSKVSVSLYWNSSTATPDTTASGVSWFESYLESADGGATFSALSTVDPTAVKTGPVCTSGINCSGNRQLGDFQSVAIDGAGRANVAYNRVNGSVTEVRFCRQS
jgi:hypothetical protein